MTNGWRRMKLGDLAEVQSGSGFPTKFQGNVGEELPFYKVSDMNLEGNERAMFHESNSISEQVRRTLGAAVFPKGSVIFPKIGGAIATNKKRLTTRNCCVDNNVMGLIPDPARIESDFLFYFLLKHDLSEFANEAHLPSIRKTVVEGWPVYLPESLTEQRRIVDVLDKAFDAMAIAKANTERNIRNAHDLFVAALQNVFTTHRPDWKENAIGELAEHSLGKMLDKAKNKGTPRPYLRNLNVRWFGFDLSDLLEMRFLPEESLKYRVSKGDVVVCEGGYPGRAAIWEEDRPVFFQKALHRVRFHEQAHSKWFIYFVYFMNESGLLKQYFSGTGIQHFTGEALGRFRLPIPPVCELRTHVARLERLQQGLAQISRVHEQKIEALSQLKTSLLQQAFSGAL